MKITNTQKGPRGINTVGGLLFVEPGQTVEAEISAVELAVAKKTGWFDTEGEAEKTPAPSEPFKAEHHGGGKFNVTQGEEVIMSGLSKADADAFNAMSDEDKATYVDASKKP